MKEFLRDNQLFLWGFTFFAIAGAIALISMEQGDGILFASDNRSPFLDFLFYYGTKLGETFMFILFFLIFLFIRVRHSFAVGFVGISAMIVAFSAKAYFLHDRPSTFFRKRDMFEELNLVSGVDLHIGTTSFPSGHTMAGFALYALLAFFLPKNQKAWGILFLLIALIVGLSRVYLIQHFVKDIYLGAWLGLGIAVGTYFLFQGPWKGDPAGWMNKPIISLSFGKKREVA